MRQRFSPRLFCQDQSGLGWLWQSGQSALRHMMTECGPDRNLCRSLKGGGFGDYHCSWEWGIGWHSLKAMVPRREYGAKNRTPVLSNSCLVTMWASHLEDSHLWEDSRVAPEGRLLTLRLDMRSHRKCVWISIRVAYLSGAVHRVPKGRAWAFSGEAPLEVSNWPVLTLLREMEEAFTMTLTIHRELGGEVIWLYHIIWKMRKKLNLSWVIYIFSDYSKRY